MTVFDFKRGKKARITRIDIEGGARARLSALGIKEGAEVEILSFSLFKSGVLICVGATRVGVRKSLAQKISAEGVQ